MVQEPLQLRALDAVSPTLAEVLRVCKLRAGLSRAGNANQHILGNPKAWLGTAYHAVLEAVGSHQSDDLEGQVREAWNAAIQREYDRARTHPWDKRFGPPESWPGYYAVAAMALVRAKQLAESRTHPNMAADGEKKSGPFREKKFSGANGKLVGRPDVVDYEEVVDFKTGEIFEDEEQGLIKSSYLRQLRIYGFLVRETLGWWPQKGVILPMMDAPVEIALDPGECIREAEGAVRLLEEYNAAIAGGLDPLDLASPSPASCRWCHFQLYCPPFWNSVELGWTDDVGADAVEGRTEAGALPIHNGSAVSLSIQVERGTVPATQRVSLSPLDPSVHVDVAQVKTGDRVRVIGLRRRADDNLVATKQTMIVREECLPRIEIEA